MPEYIVPEMIRTPLFQTILKVKILDEDTAPEQLLKLAMDPPEKIDIYKSIFALKQVYIG